MIAACGGIKQGRPDLCEAQTPCALEPIDLTEASEMVVGISRVASAGVGTLEQGAGDVIADRSGRDASAPNEILERVGHRNVNNMN